MIAVYPTLILSADPLGNLFVTQITPQAIDRTLVSISSYAVDGTAPAVDEDLARASVPEGW